MKFTIDIDCTPQEARAFFGLPDVTALHETMLKEFEERMRSSMNTMDPEAMASMMTSGMPGGFSGFGDMQKTFWTQMMGMAGAAQNKDGD
ncbi:MAG: hypothetical protein HON65_08180 [Rhodospirillales bacterium]|mgnify:FL=1|jgi:hypothetical protein|nr:hypothetical protein [Rhodospirillales bacterium]